MTKILIALLVVAIIIIILILFLLIRKQANKQSPTFSNSNNDIGKQLYKLEKDVDNILKNNEEFKQNGSNVISILTNSQNKIDKMSNLFSNDRTRGKYGEYALEIILEDILGVKNKYWFTQYSLPSGKIIDFYIKTGIKNENILIDCKFPTDDYMEVLQNKSNLEIKENFKKNVKTMITSLKKYIDKKEQVSSVIMFLPSESLFYNIMQNDSYIFEFALKNRIWIAGPTSLAPILFSQSQIIKEYELNKNAEKIKNSIVKLQDQFKRFQKRTDEVFDYYETSVAKISSKMKDVQITTNKIVKGIERLEEIETIEDIV